MTHKRRRSWTLDWLELMATASHDRQVQLRVPMNQPLVSSRTFNNERYTKEIYQILNTTLTTGESFGKKLARTVYELEGVSLEPYTIGNMVIHPQVQDGTLNLFVTIPVAYMNELPSFIIRVCFLGLDAIAWLHLLDKFLKPGVAYCHVLDCKHDRFIKELADEYREGYTHEYKPIPEPLYEAPYKLLDAVKHTFTFPCQRWWDK